MSEGERFEQGVLLRDLDTSLAIIALQTIEDSGT